VALSNGDGTFAAAKQVSTIYPGGSPVTDVNVWAQLGATQAAVGDFNGDGHDDIALQNTTAGWQSIPVIFANGGSLGNGGLPGALVNFTISNLGGAGNSAFATLAENTGVQLVAGDFDGDGAADLALTGVSSWQSVPIAFSLNTRYSLNGGGLFQLVNAPASQFAQSAGQSRVIALTANSRVFE
jgi:hypothetical protein